MKFQVGFLEISDTYTHISKLFEQVQGIRQWKCGETNNKQNMRVAMAIKETRFMTECV